MTSEESHRPSSIGKPSGQDTLRHIQSSIQKMMAERARIEGMQTNPSDYWKSYIAQFEHLITGSDLTPFYELRRHTHVITGARPSDHPLMDEKVRYLFRHLRLPSWIFKVVQEPRALAGFGVELNGCFVNRDIVRYLAFFSVLDQAGLLQPSAPLNVLEIGGGWGGLAHHFRQVFPRSTYVIVDLPETLIFSASYVTQLNPAAKIYIYDPQTAPSTLSDEFLRSYSWVFLPHWKIKELPSRFFDLTMNMASLQEMTVAQVEEYMRELHRLTRGFFYSQNKKNIANHELDNVHPYIAKKFTMTRYGTVLPDSPLGRLRDFWTHLRGPVTRLPQHDAPPAWEWLPGYLHYLCTPRRDIPEE